MPSCAGVTLVDREIEGSEELSRCNWLAHVFYPANTPISRALGGKITASFQQTVPIIRQGDRLSRALVGARRTLATNKSIPVLPRTPEELWHHPLPSLSLPLHAQPVANGWRREKEARCKSEPNRCVRSLGTNL